MKIKRTDHNFSQYTVFVGPDKCKDYILEADDDVGEIIYLPEPERKPTYSKRKFGRIHIVRLEE